jgi:hypothetical protein
VMTISRRRMLLHFLPSAFLLLPKHTFKRKLRWLNHCQSLLRRNLLPLLQSVRKGKQRRLLLLMFISHLLLLTIWVLLCVSDSIYSWALRLSYNLCSAAFDAEVSFSWCWMRQDSGDC